MADYPQFDRKFVSTKGRPRIIRKVVKTDRAGLPKRARDRKAGLDLERITAQIEHRCKWHACPHGRVIAAGSAYAKVFQLHRVTFIAGRSIPTTSDYHFECVPVETKPMVRFFLEVL